MKSNNNSSNIIDKYYKSIITIWIWRTQKREKKSLNNPTFNLDNNNFYISIIFLLVLFSIPILILFDSILLLVVYYYYYYYFS